MASRPRWVTKIQDALAVPENKTQVRHQVVTVDARDVPHVHTQGHREFVIPNTAPNLPLLLLMTDVRTAKVAHILANPSVELAWWMEGSKDQFRIAGRAYVVPAPGHEFENATWTPPSLAMIALDEGGEAGRKDGGDGRIPGRRTFDWEKKRRELFEGNEPHSRARYCSPNGSGSPMTSHDEKSTWTQSVPSFEDLKTEEERRNYEVGLSRFAVMVVEPFKVDWLQMGEHPNRRTLFTRRDEHGGSTWDEEIVIP